MIPFYNRKMELDALEERWRAGGAQFALLYGRRRLGKTYLLQRFLGSEKPHCYFLAAETSAAANLNALAEALLRVRPDAGISLADLSTLGNILRFASRAAEKQRFALVIDEFQYLVEQDRSISSQIQAWWDTEGIRGNVFLVLCGSDVGTMECLGGANAPLFGRFTFRYKLPPMSYRDTALFYEGSDYSNRDKLTAFGVLGGVPRYHALFDPAKSLAENISQNILSPVGLLRHEPESLLLSSHLRDVAAYNAVIASIANGATRPNEIMQQVGITNPQVGFYLRNLLEMEWIRREHPFGETSDRRAIYVVNDLFARFWYRFVSKLRSELEFEDHRRVYDASVKPFLSDYMGMHAFEEICRQFLRSAPAAALGSPIRRASRYWSRNGSVEIDLVGELADGRHMFCECKWSSSPVGVAVYYGLRDKVARMPAEYRREPLFVLISFAGFDADMQATARRDGVALFSGDDLLPQQRLLTNTSGVL